MNMRKAQKQEVLDFIKSLYEAHREIKAALGRQAADSVQNMLSECQEFAVSLGEDIEKLEGENHPAVARIEEYCEALFHCFEEIQNGSASEKKISQILNRQLMRVETSVKNDIAVKKEVVFFPYKASMWDSLESVYLAAREDPECDAYCVPIPYYDRNPDGSLGQMHYEGREYPKDIEVTDWQAYRFEERKPDEIYIHNPYDNYNLVTSVHPRFYSNNLKKYTEKLVYIPYFMLEEIEPDNQAAIDGMKHFIWTMGVINADKVIVQSEKMKRIYVEEYLKEARKNGLGGRHVDREYLEKKILGLGSPKIDKVRNTRKEDLDIPEAWLRVIRKPDGSWKKIILYNTAISGLLKHDEKWVDKIEDSLKIFKERQEEAALIWRPHPLIENTIKTLRPTVQKKYCEIKGGYIKEGWGIYDDTAELDRAVALSDGYYGDASSVVHLYQKVGKPVMIQNAELLYEG